MGPGLMRAVTRDAPGRPQPTQPAGGEPRMVCLPNLSAPSFRALPNRLACHDCDCSSVPSGMEIVVESSALPVLCALERVRCAFPDVLCRVFVCIRCACCE